MNYDIIIAHRNENSFRERNLNEILKYYVDIIKEDSKIIIVEQDTETNVFKHPKIIHIKEKYNMDEFWKSKLLNRGIKASNKEAFMIVDNDAIISKDAMQYMNELDVDSIAVMFPYNQVKMMSEAETRIWIRTGKLPTNVDRSYQKMGMCYTGFFMVVTRKTYDLVNGFDECYIGWGGEDDAFVIKSFRLAKVTKIPIPSRVTHIYHPRKDTPERLESKQYKMSVYSTHALKTMSKEDLIRYCNGTLDLHNYVTVNGINEASLKHHTVLKNGKSFDVPLTGVNAMPNENGEYTLRDVLESLYNALGKDAFVINMKRVIDSSDDEEEKEYYRHLTNEIYFSQI